MRKKDRVAREFLEGPPLASADEAKIAHVNGKGLLKLDNCIACVRR